MPSRNQIKVYSPDSFYHLYNRGVNRRRIFKDQQDYTVFLSLFKRHLGQEIITDKAGRPYEKLDEHIDLLAYCLMPNHFHLFIYQRSPHAITDLMRRIMTAYSSYFNDRYDRVGHLYQGRFKAALILSDDYLLHISRYIHLNPLDFQDDFEKYDYSSYADYLGKRNTSWLNPSKILELHNNSAEQYRKFCLDYVEYKKALNYLKPILADS